MIRSAAAPDGQVLSVLAPEREELERRLRVELGAGGSFLRKEGLRLLASGGKRLRPSMALAAAHLGTYDRERALPVAVAIELIHMATLVHDDVIDSAPVRRGAATTFARHGAHAAVYSGDWLLVRALRALNSVEGVLSSKARAGAGKPRAIRVPDLLVSGLDALIGGEVDQYLGRGKLPSVATYVSRIERKTAALFEAACAAGAASTGASDAVVLACAGFGRAYGIAFQIHDDLLDLGGTARAAGKPIAHDLREGIATLPFLLAAKRDRAFRDALEAHFASDADEAPRAAEAARLAHRMRALGGLEDARAFARRYEKNAEERLAALPSGVGRDLLAALSRFPD